jgi:asparagine synthase (glutamine-hydrolysing)
MSILFGIGKLGGAVAAESELQNLARATARYAPDGCQLMVAGQVGMGFQPDHTHERSRAPMPASDEDGNMLSFDGRLDNFRELAQELDLGNACPDDSAIVLAGFRRWAHGVFHRLVGEWALALWAQRQRCLYLARDHAGTRPLFFQRTGDAVLWSSYPETLLHDNEPRALNVDYVARYLGCLPLRDLTPFKGIRSVLPAHYIVMTDDRVASFAHWDWLTKSQIRYKTDTDYEERFFELFEQAVARRTSIGTPVLAQLSGGIDSSSIVCMSDHARTANGRIDLMDTVSFYDDTEPNWNERPFFEVIERQRGKVGMHVDASFLDIDLSPEKYSSSAQVFPVVHTMTTKHQQELDSIYERGHYRCLISGLGGDELLGGASDPLPELADYIRFGCFAHLFKRSFEWSLVDRSPIITTLVDAMKYRRSMRTSEEAQGYRRPPWLRRSLSDRCADALRNDVATITSFDYRCVATDNAQTWWTLVESLPHFLPDNQRRLEYRYPYLDKDLVNYMFRIPRSQVTRPGHRRSLMRRALRNIVPPEVLNRRRKAFRIRAPLVALQRSEKALEKLLSNSIIASCDFIDTKEIQQTLSQAANGIDIQWWVPLTRAIALELWIQANRRYVRP